QDLLSLTGHQEHYAAAVGQDEVIGGNRDAIDLDRLVEVLFDDSTAGGSWHCGTSENREAQFARLVDVARGSTTHDTCDAADLRRRGEDATLTGRVGARVLDDDDVAGVRSFDGARAEVPRGRAAVGVDELHRHDTAGDLGRRRERRNSQHRARQTQA